MLGISMFIPICSKIRFRFTSNTLTTAYRYPYRFHTKHIYRDLIFQRGQRLYVPSIPELSFRNALSISHLNKSLGNNITASLPQSVDQAVGFSGVNFCPGIRFWELKFAQALDFWQVFDKKHVIFDKRLKKVAYLLKNSHFGTQKYMQTCPFIRFLGTFLHWH